MTLAALDRTLGVYWIEVLRHVWQSALILVPLFFLARILRSAPPRWSHRLWVAALAKLFIPLALFGPLVGAALQRVLANTAISRHGSGFRGFRVLVTVIGADAGASVLPAIGRLPAPFWTVCTLAYVAIALWLIVRMTRDFSAARRLARATAAVEGDLRGRLESAIGLAGVASARVIVSDSNSMPAVVGTIRPRIVVPRRLVEALDAEELSAVLLHEEMHRRSGDPAIALVQRVASTLLFFFPLLAPMQRRLRETAELRCDDDALRAGAEPRAYARALARTIYLQLDPSPAPAALGDGSPSLMARRLARLSLPWRTQTMTQHRVALAVAVAILAAGVFFPLAPSRVIAGAQPEVPELDRLSNTDRRVTLRFENAPAAEVLAAIAEAGELHLYIEGPEDCCLVSVSLTDAPLRQALEVLAAKADVLYEVVDPNSLRVLLLPRWPKDGVTMPEVLTKTNPVYPKDARNARAGGRVILEALIREDGTVGEVRVLTPAKDWPSLDEAAIVAVRQWIYRPAMKDGRPVSIYFTVAIDFRIQ